VTRGALSPRASLARSRGALLLIPLAIFGIFIPVLIVPYAFSDDYAVLAIAEGLGGRPVTGQNIPGGFFGTNILDTVAGSGRPLAGLLDDLVYSATGTIANLRFIRLVGIVGIVLLAFLLRWALVRSGVKSVSAALIVVLVCSLPAFQVYGSWAVLFNVPYAAVIAGCASLFAVGAVDAPRHLVVDRVVGALALMLAALLIYQPAAMFLWVFLAVALVGAVSEPRRALRLVGAHLAVACGALGLAFLAFKTHYAGVMTPNPRDALTTDVVGKARWFVNDALYEAANLGNLTPSPWPAAVVAILAIGGIPLFLRQRRARQPLLFVGIAAALVPLSYLPNLLVLENLPYYRTQLAISSLVALYACAGAVGIWLTLRHWLEPRITGKALRAVTRLAVVAAVTVMAASAVLAARNVLTLFVRPQRTELRLLRSQVAALPTGVRRVAFMGTPYNAGATDLVRYDEFGLPSTAHPFAYAPIVLLLLHEEGRLTPPPYPIVDILPYPPPTLPKNEPVINVAPMLEQLR
jgi:hypothetical protein